MSLLVRKDQESYLFDVYVDIYNKDMCAYFTTPLALTVYQFNKIHVFSQESINFLKFLLASEKNEKRPL